MKVFILAAGLGTRLGKATQTTPKVMMDIGGRPVLEHLVHLCVKHRLPDIIINLHHLPDTVTGHFGDGTKYGARITYSDETSEILGGAGAIKNAEQLLKDDTFIVLNGDTLTDLNLTVITDFHRRKNALATFFVHQTEHPYDSDLVDYDANARITRFYRALPGATIRPISKSGVHVFEPEVLDKIPAGEFYSLEKDLIPKLLQQNEKLFAYLSDAYAVDMGTPERLEQVRSDFKSGKIKF